MKKYVRVKANILFELGNDKHYHTKGYANVLTAYDSSIVKRGDNILDVVEKGDLVIANGMPLIVGDLPITNVEKVYFKQGEDYVLQWEL